MRFLRRFFGLLRDHDEVSRRLDQHEKTLRNHENRLDHLRRERKLYADRRKHGSAG
jgi:hypothetical protein